MYISGYIGEGRFDGLRSGDEKILTHVNFSFAVVKDGLGSVAHWKNADKVREFMQNKQGIKAVLSVGGWGAGGFSDACSTPEGIEKLSSSLVAIMEDYGFDGIDLDWEYPGIGAAGIDHSPADKENFTAWVQSLRNKLGKDKLITMAAGAFQGCIDNLEIDKLVNLLDFFNLMTYDMTRDLTNRRHTCHHTALYESPNSNSMYGDKAVNLYLAAGVPLDKLVLGAAFYARIFAGASGLDTPFNGEVPTWTGGYADALERAEKAGGVQYDDQAKAAYAFDENTKEFITFDDPRSVKAKFDYVKTKGLKGIMFWEYTCDDKDSTLLRAMQ
ncbi:MAG: glycosyl hydrolase family 18 protein [Defluviitaleaceae bacterium]|nr:glycosyl hydrolase family 18 protein [Defluviitaleaceae bacterium]